MATWTPKVAHVDRVRAAHINALQTIKADMQKLTAAQLAALGVLDAGELCLETDTRRVFVGSSMGNQIIKGDYITPEMYGAKGDGTTDDTAAIQAAINACGGTGGLVGGPYGNAVAGGGVVRFASKIYKITAPLLVEKSSVKLVGQGAGLTTIKYISTTATITDIIRFKYCSSCEISKMSLDGGTGQLGANANAAINGLYLDLVDFFYSEDLTIKFTKLNGIKACRMWESFFANLAIHSTGWYATAATPSAGIWYTLDDSETYPAIAPASTGSNNTTFSKLTICPYGNLITIDAQNTVNQYFNDLIYEAYPIAGTDHGYDTAFNEDKVAANIVCGNIRFDGGLMSLHAFDDQAGEGIAFNIKANAYEFAIKNFAVSDDSGSGGNAGISTVLKTISSFPIEIDGLYIYDLYKNIASYFDLQDDHYTVGGNIFIQNDYVVTATDLDGFFTGGSIEATQFYNDIYVRNTYLNEFYSWKLNQVRARTTSTTNDPIDSHDNLILVDTSGGNVNINAHAWRMPNRHVIIKKSTGDANLLTIGLNGANGDGNPASIGSAAPYCVFHLYSDGTNFYYLNRTIEEPDPTFASLSLTGTADYPLEFAASVGGKITLYPGQNWGIGLQGNLVQFINHSVDGDWQFGSGTSASFTPVVTIDGGTGRISAATATLTTLPSYANNAAAVAGGLTAGMLYRTGGDPDAVCVVH